MGGLQDDLMRLSTVNSMLICFRKGSFGLKIMSLEHRHDIHVSDRFDIGSQTPFVPLRQEGMICRAKHSSNHYVLCCQHFASKFSVCLLVDFNFFSRLQAACKCKLWKSVYVFKYIQFSTSGKRVWFSWPCACIRNVVFNRVNLFHYHSF